MHKTIGIIGGLSAESTITYYQYITRSYIERANDFALPEIIIYSVNRENYTKWRAVDRWDLITADLIEKANKLQAAGADFGLIATNTMHKLFDEVQRGTSLPLLHILEPTVKAIKAQGLETVGLLGTAFTMREPFYMDGLRAQGITPLVPEKADQDMIHRVIQEELVRNLLLPESRRAYLEVIDQLARRGAEGIILGCTEIPMLVSQADCALPVFDTTILHAEAALQRSLAA